jgi:hypothetical protein
MNQLVVAPRVVAARELRTFHEFFGEFGELADGRTLERFAVLPWQLSPEGDSLTGDGNRAAVGSLPVARRDFPA